MSKYFFQYTTLASESHQVRTLSSLVSPLGVVDLPTNHKPSLPSRKPLMGINFRQDMLHENVKFYLGIYPIEAH